MEVIVIVISSHQAYHSLCVNTEYVYVSTKIVLETKRGSETIDQVFPFAYTHSARQTLHSRLCYCSYLILILYFSIHVGFSEKKLSESYIFTIDSILKLKRKSSDIRFSFIQEMQILISVLKDCL